MNEEKANALYRAANAHYSNMGDYGTFKTKLQNPEKRKILYDRMVKDGYSNLGTYDEFNVKLGTDDNTKPVDDTPKPENPENEEKGFWSNAASWAGDKIENIGAGAASMSGAIYSSLDKGAQAIESVLPDFLIRKDASGKPLRNFDRYAKESRDLSETLARKGDPYEGKGFFKLWEDGRYLAAVDKALNEGTKSTVQSATAMAATMAGLPQLGLATIGMLTATDKYDQLSADETTKDMPEYLKIINSVVTGAAEAASEMLGDIPIGKMLGRAYNIGGKQAVHKEIKNTLIGKINRQAEKYDIILAPFQEGVEEIASQISENITDKITGADPDRQVMEGVAEAFVYGAAGGAQFSLIAAPGKIKNAHDRRKAVKYYNDSEQNIREKLGKSSALFIDNIDRAVDSGDDQQIHNIFRILSENEAITEEQKSAVLQYMNARKVRSMVDAEYAELISQKKQEAEETISNYVNPKMNAVVTAVVGGYTEPVQVVDGNIAFDEYGFIDKDSSDQSVVILDGNGKRVPVSIKYIEELEENIPVTEAMEEAALIATQPFINAQQNDNVRDYEDGDLVRATLDNGMTFMVGKIAGMDEAGNYMIDVETPSGIQRVPIEPRQIVNEDNIRGIDNGSIVEYRNGNGEVIQGTVEDAHGYRQSGQMVVDGEAVSVSDIIGLAPSEIAKQGNASQRNPKYAALDDKALNQALSDISIAIESNASPEQNESFLAERDEISRELELRSSPAQDSPATQGANNTPEAGVQNEEALTDGESNLPESAEHIADAGKMIEEEKRLFYESLPKNKKGEMDENAMTDVQKLQHLEYKQGKEFTINAARKSKQNTEAEINKLRKRFDSESDLMKLDKIQDQIDFLSQRAKTYDDYVFNYQKAKMLENMRHSDRMNEHMSEQERLAEEERRKENERKELEALERERAIGVPDVSRDKATDARRRGYRIQEGTRIERQPEIDNVKGVSVTRKFSDTEAVNASRTIVDAAHLQPSHKNGVRNNSFFITEAQPKERTDDASRISAENIAKNINPQEITGGATAYTGSPIVNTRGEVIQGNNRTVALQQMYDQFPEQAEKYRQYLAEHAGEYGIVADEIMSMERPVAVDVIDVSDEKAIQLGQLNAAYTESGGVQRIQPGQTAQRLGDRLERFSSILFENNKGEDMSIGEMISRNAGRAMDYLISTGAINNTQYQSAFDKRHNLTPEAKADLTGISTQALFDGASDLFTARFDMLPAKAKAAILQTIHRDSKSAPESKIMDDIRQAVEAYSMLSQNTDFTSARTEDETRRVVWSWSKQVQMDFSEGNFIPSERFNNLAVEFAVRFHSHTMASQRQMFNALYDNLQGVGGDMFNPSEELSKIDAIRKHFNIEYNGNELQGSHALADNNGDGRTGRQGRTSEPSGGEQSTQGEQPADSRGRTERDNRERDEEVEVPNPDTLIRQMEENAVEAPQLELTPENWEAEFGEDGIVSTPVGDVKMGDNQYRKIIKNGRQKEFGMIKPTLTSPDVIIEVASEAKESQKTERPGSYLFIKTFNIHGKKIKFYTSVTVSRDGLEVVISNHYIEPKQVKGAITAGKLQYQNPDMALRPNTIDPVSLRQSAEAEDDADTSTDKDATNNSNDNNQPEEKEVGESPAGFDGDILSLANRTVKNAEIAEAETQVDTNPTEAQKEAGNYKKGHVTVQGFDISIEQPKGSTRSGVDENGKTWSTEMKNTYGYIRGTEGRDHDHIDVFLGDNPVNGKVFVVDQVNPETGEFDEHKVMMGFDTVEQAREAYLSNYEEGWQGLSNITESTVEDFRKWAEMDGRRVKPFSEYRGAQNKKGTSEAEQTVNKDELSPLQRHIQDIKEKYPNAIPMFKGGVEYLVFDEDANVAADILGKKATKTKEGRFILSLPIEEADEFLPKIVKSGKKVALVEQKDLRAQPSQKTQPSPFGVTDHLPDKKKPRFQTAQGADLEAVNEQFNKELQTLTPENADSKIFNLGNPSDVVLSTGVEDRPYRLYGNKIIKKAKKHGFSPSDLKDLPRALANPIAIFEGSLKGSRAILTELSINGNNVLVAIELGKNREIDFNIITSAYGKANKGVVDWINKVHQ